MEGRNHVLWGDGLGSMADCVPDRLPSVLVLPYSGSLHVDPRRDAGLEDELDVLLRFLYSHGVNNHGVVRHHFVSPQLRCWVIRLLHFFCFFPLKFCTGKYLLGLITTAIH